MPEEEQSGHLKIAGFFGPMGFLSFNRSPGSMKKRVYSLRYIGISDTRKYNLTTCVRRSISNPVSALKFSPATNTIVEI